MDFSPLLLVQALLIMGVFIDIVDAGKKNTIQVKSQKCIWISMYLTLTIT